MARRPRSRKASAAPQPGSFSARFSRVTASKSAKRYVDRNTGEEISYRQALKRAKEGQLTRRPPTEERKARVRAGIQRRASIRNSILKQRGLTGADVKRDPQLAALIKHLTEQSKPGGSFSRRGQISAAQFEDQFGESYKDAEEQYQDFVNSLGSVGGFIRG